jgi:hypothetical protein
VDRTRLFAGPEGQFRYETATDRGVSYDAVVHPDAILGPPTLSSIDRARYVSLPPGLPQRVRTLAADWTQGATTPLDQARAIERHLRTDYTYDLDSPAGAARNPLDDFLFDTRRGHCQFYSTAMAVLLRTQGIPTRNVTGFIGGTYNRFGAYYAVRQGDAHSWVEVHIDGQGWQRFDPTPPASAVPRGTVTGALAFLRDLIEAAAQRWDRHVLGYDLNQQVALLRSAQDRYSGGATLFARWGTPRNLLLAAGLLLAALWLWRTFRRSRPRFLPPGVSPPTASTRRVVVLYQALETWLAQAGVPRNPATPPMRHAEALRALGHPHAEDVEDLTRLYLELRFGGRDLTPELDAHFAQRLRDLRLAPSSPLGR